MKAEGGRMKAERRRRIGGGARGYGAPIPSPERTLLLAVLDQALRDLRALDPQRQAEAVRFFAHRECAWLCDLLDLDVSAVQARARKLGEEEG